MAFSFLSHIIPIAAITRLQQSPVDLDVPIGVSVVDNRLRLLLFERVRNSKVPSADVLRQVALLRTAVATLLPGADKGANGEVHSPVVDELLTAVHHLAATLNRTGEQTQLLLLSS